MYAERHKTPGKKIKESLLLTEIVIARELKCGYSISCSHSVIKEGQVTLEHAVGFTKGEN
jgi:hypothetical protein